MAQPRLVLTKEKESKVTKPVFIDDELLDKIRDLKNETVISTSKLLKSS